MPQLLWDRKTGVVDRHILAGWRNYDINVLIERRWEQLESKLKGNIHIAMGDLDTFYLDGAVVEIRKTLEKLKSDADIEMLKGKNHGNVRTPALMKKYHGQMSDQFFRDHPEHRPQE